MDGEMKQKRREKNKLEKSKLRKKTTLRKAFIGEVAITFLCVVVASGLTIGGCMKMRKWILPDSQKVYLNITKVYDDGTEKKQSMLLCFGEEEVEELKKKKEENKSTDDDYFYVEGKSNGKWEYVLKIGNGKSSVKGNTTTSEPGEKNIRYSVNKLENSYEALSPKKKQLYTGTSVAMVGLPMIYSIIGILICGFLFYKKRLGKPIRILEEAVNNISMQNLDFEICYEKKDEMGDLCTSFEKMRQELADNNRKMWKMLEERKKLQASVAHDLRNPIAIIEGYVEYLGENLKRKGIQDEKLEKSIGNLAESAKRLERYTNSIRDINNLEDIEICGKECELTELINEMREDFRIIVKKNGLELNEVSKVERKKVIIDKQILWRIVENIISNSVRFANSKIDIIFENDDKYLKVTISDDGPGFTDKIIKNKRGYFNLNNSLDEHMGMGLIISEILATKHGGSVELSNIKDGGAKVIIKTALTIS